MAKPFNIHDWQAKQRQQLLNEDMQLDADEFERENLEFDIKKHIGQTFASWMSPSHPEFSKEYAKPPYIDNLVKGIVDYVMNRYKTRMEEINTTGTGTSFQAGSGEGYMTPNAFKKKRKKK